MVTEPVMAFARAEARARLMVEHPKIAVLFAPDAPSRLPIQDVRDLVCDVYIAGGMEGANPGRWYGDFTRRLARAAGAD